MDRFHYQFFNQINGLDCTMEFVPHFLREVIQPTPSESHVTIKIEKISSNRTRTFCIIAAIVLTRYAPRETPFQGK